jgi:hypothetical protein
VRKRTVQNGVEANEQCDLNGNVVEYVCPCVCVCVCVCVCILYSVVYNTTPLAEK